MIKRVTILSFIILLSCDTVNLHYEDVTAKHKFIWVLLSSFKVLCYKRNQDQIGMIMGPGSMIQTWKIATASFFLFCHGFCCLARRSLPPAKSPPKPFSWGIVFLQYFNHYVVVYQAITIFIYMWWLSQIKHDIFSVDNRF